MQIRRFWPLPCLALLTACAATPPTKVPLTPEQRDLYAYFTTLQAPIMYRLCKPFADDAPAFKANLATWLEQNKPAVERARKTQVILLKEGQTMEDYEVDILGAHTKRMMSEPAVSVGLECLDFIKATTPEKTPTASAATPAQENLAGSEGK